MTAPQNVSEASAQAFRANAQLASHLQRTLIDLVALHLYGKQAHWNVVGPHFRDLHLQLDDLVDIAREASDTIAERMRALGAAPDARPATVAGQHALGELDAGPLDTGRAGDQVAALIQRAVSTMRLVHDDVDSQDPSTADLLHVIIHDLEKQAWLLDPGNYLPTR